MTRGRYLYGRYATVWVKQVEIVLALVLRLDLALFSQSLHHAQHPRNAVGEAWRILKPGARVAILDVRRHNFEEARELYADLWLGFTEVELQGFLRQGGFRKIAITSVHQETEAPHFETILAVGEK